MNAKDNDGLQMNHGCHATVNNTVCYDQTPCNINSIVAQLSDYVNILTGQVNLNAHKTTLLNALAKE